MSFFALFRGQNSAGSSQPIICVTSELTEFFAELTEFAAELSEFSLPKQYSRNSIPLLLPMNSNLARKCAKNASYLGAHWKGGAVSNLSEKEKNHRKWDIHRR